VAADELEKIVNQIQSPLLVASSEVIPVAAEARQRCPSIKVSDGRPQGRHNQKSLM